ncbi:hypothetical protein FBU59_006889 [Linderina macrospora]|uniref:Uncharacterized protein n=1 Tax=Linderina macrospora TaxID=4868 RepID=A0ACC1IYK9_9FUNG|nr:hypothetical protein FBU59_006889 [Linderina macrospora]
MCSVTRFSDNTQVRHDNTSDDEEDDVDDEDVLDLTGPGDDENRPNVVSLAKLMIDQYQAIFKPTLEAAEAQAKEQAAQRQPPPKPARRSTPRGDIPPVKPPRRTPSDTQPKNDDSLVQASDEDIAALAEAMGRSDLVGSATMNKPVSAEDISKRLQAEHDAAAKAQAAKGSKPKNDDDEEIVIGNFV